MAMGRVLVGTCSWSDRSLVESGWYPREASTPASRLHHYAQNFETVEVDSTFYALPQETTVFRWALRTPPNFIFNIKAYGLFTFHKIAYGSLPLWLRKELPARLKKDDKIARQAIPFSLRRTLWKQFINLITPLHQMKRLGYLLFQLPPWLGYSSSSINYLKHVASMAPPFKIAVEVRNGSWLREGRKSFESLLKDGNMAYVMVDEPQLSWTVPPEMFLTAAWGGVVRFHGRNKSAWEQKGASVQDRFRYRYKEEELLQWKDSLLCLKDHVPSLFIMFNNCYRNFAVSNALQMQKLFEIAPPKEGLFQKTLNFEGEKCRSREKI
ncbi:MAG TPA: hypothetical protein DEP01_05250 [Aminobacterium sp.]|uniref:DUF72 domain-containing protein n=2 Tax=Aminobacterium TaxID=81466 RepID=UPI000EC97661|nr:hypothetical protein [Aminobacterium sp.]